MKLDLGAVCLAVSRLTDSVAVVRLCARLGVDAGLPGTTDAGLGTSTDGACSELRGFFGRGLIGLPLGS